VEAELTDHTWWLSDTGMDLLERAGLVSLLTKLDRNSGPCYTMGAPPYSVSEPHAWS
jgi:hypothetical protein